MSITFFAHGTPKGQPRPRAFARKFGDKWSARVYDAGTAEGWKSEIAIAAKARIPSTPMTGHVCVTLEFYLPRPKAHFRMDGTIKASAPSFPTGKPDIENLAKAVLDCLTALGFWRDDSQVVRLELGKLYVPYGGKSGAQIKVDDSP